MATTTPRLGLTKPDGTDLVDIAVINANYDILDNQLVTTPSTNYVINGAFDFWQRGTSFSNPGTGVYTSDRWATRRDGSGFTSSFYRYALGSNELNTTGLNYAAIYSITNAGTSNTYNGIINKIEDVRTLENQTVTVSFWAKNVSGSSSITPIIQNWYGTGGSTQTFNVGTAISLTGSWARYSQTITVTSTSGKTVGADSYNGLIFNFTPATTIQVAITGVQLEVGSTATAFRRNQPNTQAELAACQRYYQLVGTGGGMFCPGAAYSTTQMRGMITFKVPMRVTPTSFDYSSLNDFSALNYGGGGGSTITSLTMGSQNVDSVFLTAGGTGFTLNVPMTLRSSSSAIGIGFSAEL